MLEIISHKEIIGIISIIITISAYLLYFKSIFNGITKPHMFSWIIWGTIMGIAFASQLSDNAGAGSWGMGATALACFVIAGLSYFHGEKNITKSDWIFFLFALSAIPIWMITKTPFWSVIIVTVIDVLGFVPTVRKSLSKPYEENVSLYALSSLNFFITLFALEHYSFITAFYPIFLTFIDGGFALLLVFMRHRIPKRSVHLNAPNEPPNEPKGASL